jgi:hypothetical protein
VAQNIRVNIEFDEEYKVTHAHSKYKYEPEQLPSSKITFKLSDLNADEQRNLVFQLSVPKVQHEQSVEMASQEPMSQSQASEDQQSTAENHAIGKFQRRSDQIHNCLKCLRRVLVFATSTISAIKCLQKCHFLDVSF